MNRTFRARVTSGQYIFIGLTAGLLVYGLWTRQIWIALAMVVLVLPAIERLIHTAYTLTDDGKLVLTFGRLARTRVIPLTEVTGMERVHGLRYGRLRGMRSVLLHLSGGKSLALQPAHEADFIKTLQKAGIPLRQTADSPSI